MRTQPGRAVFCAMSLLVAPACSPRGAHAPLIRPAIPAAPARSSVLWAEPFDLLSPERWREVEVRGTTQYEAVTVDGRACVRARSEDGASILLSALDFDPDTFEWLTWSWRVDELVEGEALQEQQGSDAAARLYVYFASGGLPWQKRNLDYVWSAHLPVGTVLDSAFTPLSKIVVVESGRSALGRWRTVQRNLEEDYEKAFGEDAPNVVAIGLMTDTDSTGGRALAYFDDLQISRKPVPFEHPADPGAARR